MAHADLRQQLIPAKPTDKTNPQHAREFTPVLDLGPINPPKYGD